MAEASLHYPLPVTFNGEECKRADWLAGAFHQVTWNGCRIGVYEGSRPYTPSLNFHGLTINCKLPTVSETRAGALFYAKVDIQDCPALQLVLPARKEAVINDALRDLHDAVERSIYEAIRERPLHRLSHANWRRAAEIGVDLPEANPALNSWFPSIADSGTSYGLSKLITAEDAVIIESDDPDVEQCVARALNDNPIRQRLVDADSNYAGYSWYDRLARLDNFRFDVEHPGGAFTIASTNAEPMPTTHLKVSSITLLADLTDQASTTTISAGTDVALVSDQSIWDGLDAARIIYRDTLLADDLIDILDATYFSPNDDSESDSWDTQHRRFESDARDVAITLLRGPDEAICDQFRSLLRDARWLLPKDVNLILSIRGDDIEVSIERIPEPVE